MQEGAGLDGSPGVLMVPVVGWVDSCLMPAVAWPGLKVGLAVSWQLPL